MHGYLSTKEAAARVGVSDARIRQLCKQGRLGAEKFGRDWLVPVSALETWLATDNDRRYKDHVRPDS